MAQKGSGGVRAERMEMGAMILYTENGLQRLSRIFNLYEQDPAKLSWTDLGEAKDYVRYKEASWIEDAWKVADYLETKLPEIKAVTKEKVEQWERAYNKWIAGEAKASDMPDVLSYCVFQANLWEDELDILETFIKSKGSSETA